MKRILLWCLSACLLLSALPFSVPAEEKWTPVASRADLLSLGENPSGNYRLTADIDLGDAPWMPVPFSGRFDGNGHTLYNLTVRETGAGTVSTYDGNRLWYDTSFAGLFSTVLNAEISNLSLVNADVVIETEKDCFAAALAGYAAHSTFTNCWVTTRTTLLPSGKNVGVGGLIGFCDESEIRACTVDAVLTFTDQAQDVTCEEFLGGIYASGSGRIFDCVVHTLGRAEIYGYAHNGGAIGMHKLRRNTSFRPRLLNTAVTADLAFFEVAPARRAYCEALIGEDSAKDCYLRDNTVVSFEKREAEPGTRLTPDPCAAPLYDAVVIEPTCTEWGYTTYTCRTCGYAYTDRYTPPAHRFEATQPRGSCTAEEDLPAICTICGETTVLHVPAGAHTPGEWRIATEPEAGVSGTETLTCAVCGAELETRPIAPLPEPTPPPTAAPEPTEAPISPVPTEAPKTEEATEENPIWAWIRRYLLFGWLKGN